MSANVAKGSQELTIPVEERQYGKAMTVVEGFDPEDVVLSELATTLKSRLACGGTVKEGTIELKGDHRGRVEEILEEEGFSVAATTQ